MSSENSSNGVPDHQADEPVSGRILDDAEWERVRTLLRSTPEEEEKVLRESRWLDIDEVNKLLGITPEEITEFQKSRRGSDDRRDGS